MTRPEDQAYKLLADLARDLGSTPAHVISPLLRIVPVEAPPTQPTPDWVAFTSANGVRAYAAASADRPPALCVGAATADAATSMGFAARSADGDVAALARLAEKVCPRGARVLHAGGEHVSGDLTAHLRAAGLRAQRVTVYRQVPQPLNDAAYAALQAGPVLAPIYSPRTAQLLAAAVAPITPHALICVAISAAAVPAGVPTQVTDRPTRDAMRQRILATLRDGP